MEQHANFCKNNIRYAKITLKVRIVLSIEAATTSHISFGEKLIHFKGSQEAWTQTVNCQTDCQKIQGRRNLL